MVALLVLWATAAMAAGNEMVTLVVMQTGESPPVIYIEEEFSCFLKGKEGKGKGRRANERKRSVWKIHTRRRGGTGSSVEQKDVVQKMSEAKTHKLRKRDNQTQQQ